ncbi:MAG: penicillin acylase family protein [Aggregatilineales bacterium]
MKLLRNILLVLVVLLVIAGGALALIYNSWTAGPLPQHAGEITVAGLQGDVEIMRDEWGVPHIYADSSYDLFFAQGYTQAQDRWWQMEFFRHTGKGRIQELTGQTASLTGTDIFIRTVGWEESAQNDLDAMRESDPESVAYLEAFADGVNAYINSRDKSALALEYNLLGVTGVNIEIESWSPLDTIVWTKVMSWDLSGNQGTERTLSGYVEDLGEAMVADLIPDYPFDDKPTIVQPEDLPDEDSSFEADFAAADEGLTGVETRLAGNFNGDNGFVFGKGDGIGSNNWVVHGDMTDTGMPLLANDPHLGIGMPSIWFEVGLHCRTVNEDCPYNVVGFTFSPSPGVVIGHNDNIGWGVTNVGWDTQDLYRLEINPENDLQYKWNDDWRDMTVRDEVIRYGDSDETLVIQVRETHLGPIVNDNQLDDDNNPQGFNNADPLAMRWTAYETGQLVQSILLLNKATNFDEFRDALELWTTPAQNFVFADTEGNIGYQTPGLIPVRAAGHTGTLPIDGTTDEFEWRGYVPFEHLPTIWNPERDYIATANQALVPFEYYDQLSEKLSDEFGDDAHYPFDYMWAFGYRGERIVEMLEAEETHSWETFQQIHGDNQMTVMKELTPYLEALDFEDESMTDMRDWMLDWDYQMHMDSSQAALAGQFWKALMRNLYDDELGEGEASGGTSYMWATRLLADDPENIWWDDVETDDATETRDEILIQSFEEAVVANTEAQGENRDDWAWGALHTATFESNPLGLSGIDLIEDMVNHGPIPTSGGSAIVNATGWRLNDFSVRAVPSMRMILDMSDLSQSRVIHTTGQSGHPFSDNYSNMVDPWRNIEYHTMLWTREQVEAAAVNTLTLKPE